MCAKVVLLVCRAGRYQDSLAAALRSTDQVERVWILEEWVNAPVGERLTFPDTLLFEYPQSSGRLGVIGRLRNLFPEMRCLPLIDDDRYQTVLELQGFRQPMVKGFSVDQLIRAITDEKIHSPVAPQYQDWSNRPSH